MTKSFLLLSFLMGVVVLSSNYLVQFPINYYGFNEILTYGAFSYPIAFLITDLTNRSFGKLVARKIVYFGFFFGIGFTILFSTDFADYISLRIAIGSGIAFLVSQLLDVQIFDASKIDFSHTEFKFESTKEAPVIIVMDYAFGEQAYETIDELLKPFKTTEKNIHLNVDSISVMGKAGILEGTKGDIMIPSAHIFEGTADNYPFKNELTLKDFDTKDLKTFEGTMVTVLGTSLQNKDLLKFFHDSTWNVIGLEMEGAHYQKAIQAASKVRHSINPNVKVRYAY